MDFATVACLDDLTRHDYWPAKEFVYDLIRLPVYHATGLDIAKSPRAGQRHNLKPTFRAEDFCALAGLPAAEWRSLYHRLPEAAEDYLARALPPHALVIGYEMTPALTGALSRAGQPWLDIRLSPLRFGADLYLALATNVAELHARLHRFALSEAEVLTEACLLAAQVRYRRRYQPDAPRWDDALVWVGQTESDASLIDSQGRFARAGHHATAIAELARERRLVYRGHPLGGAFAERELAELRRLTGQAVPVCDLDTYELLAMDDDVAFVGLCSGVLQEAAWFGKQALSLQPPICEVSFDATHDATAPKHLQIASHVFMSEPLWAALLGAAPRVGAVQLPPRPNHLRELVNTWWGWSTVQLRHSEFQREALRLHGSAPDTSADQRIDALRMEVEGLKEALRVVLRQTAERRLLAHA